MQPGKHRISRFAAYGFYSLLFLPHLVDAQTQPFTCARNYSDRVLAGPVPDDITELLVAAYAATDAVGANGPSMALQAYAENRTWLKAMGETPSRAPSSVGAATEFSLVDLAATRQRGAAKILKVELLALASGTDPVPQAAAPTDDDDDLQGPTTTSSKEGTLSARFRVTNVGHEPVAALRLKFSRPESPSGPLEDCTFRPFHPLREGERAEVVCTFAAPGAVLTDWRHSLESQARTGESSSPSNHHPIVQDVSFWEGGHTIPYLPYNSSLMPDPEIRRIAEQRATTDCSGGELRAFGKLSDLLVWIGLPAVLGTLLGRRIAR